jgi:hypothetical protein
MALDTMVVGIWTISVQDTTPFNTTSPNAGVLLSFQQAIAQMAGDNCTYENVSVVFVPAAARRLDMMGSPSLPRRLANSDVEAKYKIQTDSSTSAATMAGTLGSTSETDSSLALQQKINANGVAGVVGVFENKGITASQPSDDNSLALGLGLGLGLGIPVLALGLGLGLGLGLPGPAPAPATVSPSGYSGGWVTTAAPGVASGVERAYSQMPALTFLHGQQLYTVAAIAGFALLLVAGLVVGLRKLRRERSTGEQQRMLITSFEDEESMLE